MKGKERRLREMAALGWPTKLMAREFGIKTNTVSQYLRELGISYLKFNRNLQTGRRNILPVLDILRLERMRKGLTLTVFAQRTGWDRSVIGEWETGKRRIHGPGLVDYANALGFEITLKKIDA